MIRFCLSIFYSLIILQSTCTVIASPSRETRDINNQQIVGQASNIIASTILKANAESNKNYVFSPLGYTTLLAILGEGAKDEAGKDISVFLKHPDESQTVRSAYRSVLKSLQGDSPLISPQFKTWLYVYRNNTVENDFKSLLTDSYFVEIKEIDRDNFNNQNAQTSEDTATDALPALGDDFEEATTVTIVKPIASGSPNNSKDIPDFETLKKNDPVDLTRKETQKDASKFDEVVEDRQYVEVPVIKKELLKEKNEAKESELDANQSNDKIDGATADKSESQDDDVIANVEEIVNNEPQRIRLPLKQFEELEIMHADESRFIGKSFGGTSDGDGTSVISGNSIVGEKETITEGDTSKYESKMILFNGLYFRGMWAVPFQQLRFSCSNVFYSSEGEKYTVKMMRTRGSYKMADIKSLDAQAIEFPYENERYSLLVVMPNTYGGLKKLINEFGPNRLYEIANELTEESLDIWMPKFQIDTTGGAEKSLIKAGLASIFTSKADFSGISKEQKLHIEELQQHVSFRIDEGSSTENFLTATNALRSNVQPDSSEKMFNIDRPFLYFVRDITDNVIIIAGKITSLPEFDQTEIDEDNL